MLAAVEKQPLMICEDYARVLLGNAFLERLSPNTSTRISNTIVTVTHLLSNQFSLSTNPDHILALISYVGWQLNTNPSLENT